MKLTDTIIDLCLQMMLDNSINTGAIYDHICDIVFDLYKIMTNTEVFNVTLTKQLIDIYVRKHMILRLMITLIS